ncbi:MAG: PAS domain-containing protein, partial [Spirochaetia bacterium]
TFQDITAQQNAQRRFQLAVDAAEEGLWDWDVRTGESFRNDTWFEMLGYEPGELPMTIQTWEKLVHPDDLPKALAERERYFAGQTDRELRSTIREALQELLE